MFSSNLVKEKELRQAAADGRLHDVKKLIEEDHINIDAFGADTKKTALHWAVIKNHAEIVTYLLSKQAALLPDKNDATAYDLTNNLNMKRILVRHFKAIQSKNNTLDSLTSTEQKFYGFQIHPDIVTKIAQAPNLNTLQQIMKFHNLTADSYVQGIPLISLVMIKDANSIKNGKMDFLVTNCTNINITAHPIQINFYQNTTLHALLVNEYEQEALALIKKALEKKLAIDPSIQDVNGRTILHLCVIFRFHDLFQFCLENVACKNAIDLQDNDGKTILHYAYLLGDQTAIALIEKSNAKTDIADNNGKSPRDMLDTSDDAVAGILTNLHIDPLRKLKSNQTVLEDCIHARSELRSHLSKGAAYKYGC